MCVMVIFLSDCFRDCQLFALILPLALFTLCLKCYLMLFVLGCTVNCFWKVLMSANSTVDLSLGNKIGLRFCIQTWWWLNRNIYVCKARRVHFAVQCLRKHVIIIRFSMCKGSQCLWTPVIESADLAELQAEVSLRNHVHKG